MLAEASFWLKLWNKGIDISASIIASTVSAAIIALIATLTWRWKRQRDLRFEEDKQRQQQRLKEEFEENERSRAAKATHDRLAHSREEYALAMGYDDRRRAIETWEAYRQWMQAEGLDLLPANSKIPADPFISQPPDLAQFFQELADLIRSTELPAI